MKNASKRACRRTTPPETLEVRALLATITVNSLGDELIDDGAVTLREAIHAANTDTSVDGSVAGEGVDTIVFDASLDGVIQLESELEIFESVAIEGNGPNVTKLRGRKGDVGLLASADGVNLKVSDLRMINFDTAIFSQSAGGSLSLFQARIRGNRRGVISYNKLTIRNSEFFRNTAGAVRGIDAQSVSVSRSRFIENTGSGGEGAAGLILYRVDKAAVDSSLFVGNIGAGGGGRGAALFANHTPLDIVNSTVTNNSGGAAVVYVEGSPLAITNTTVVDNAGGGVYANGPEEGNNRFVTTNSVFAGNTSVDEQNVDVVVTSSQGTRLIARHNLFGSNEETGLASNGGTADANGNLIGSEASPLDPMLGTLQDNGGPTHTRLPATVSPLIDAGTPTGLSRDQRVGFARQAGPTVDIGAVEVVDLTLYVSPDRPSLNESNAGQPLTLRVTLREAVGQPFTVNVASVDGSAVAGSDYLPVTQALVFTGQAGETQQFQVSILDDAEFETTEFFQLTYSSTLADTVLGGTANAVEIMSDELLGSGLEDYSTLVLSGDDTDNGMSVVQNGSDIEVTVNGTTKTYAAINITSIEATLRDGADWLAIDSAITLPVFAAGGRGDDTITTGNGHDSVIGGAGGDVIQTMGGDDFVDAGGSRDTVVAGDGRDTIFGGRGGDSINGGDGVDLLHGMQGRDSIQGGGDNDDLHGGSGRDTLDGGPARDSIYGYVPGEDEPANSNENDVLRGNEGNDLLDSGLSPNDKVYGGAGNDRMFGSGELRGGSGRDHITAREGGGTLIIGGADRDWVIGSSSSDTIIGGTGPDDIQARGGDDLVDGGAGTDRILGEDGSDVLIGGVGEDRVFGTADTDLLVAGTTSLQLSELELVLAEWSSDRTFAERQANLLDGSGSAERANGNVFLLDSGVNQNLFDDSAVDSLVGGDADDWFFANLDEDTVEP